MTVPLFTVENGALRITNNICSLCNEEFDGNDFVRHLVVKKHLNRQYLTRQFCTSLALSSSYISSEELPLPFTALQPLIFYLKSQRLPLFFKQLYSCHKCSLVYDSIHILFSHLNKCDPIKVEVDTETTQPETQPENNETQQQRNESIPELNYSVKSEAHSSNSEGSPSKEDTEKNDAEEEEVVVVENGLGELLKEDVSVNNKKEDTGANKEKEEDIPDSDLHLLAEKPVTVTQAQSIIECPPHHCPKLQRSVLISIQTDDVPKSVSRLIDTGKCIRRYDITDSNETVLLKSASIPRSASPTKEFTHGSQKNGHSPKGTLESRSNKRLLRSLSKKPEPKSVAKGNKVHKAKVENDTFVVNKKKFSKICPSIIKPVKCKFCKRGNFKNETSLHVHYQNVHEFYPMKQQSELMLSRFTQNETKKCFQFRCLVCMKMFENFTQLSLHRCKYYQLNIPKKHSNRGRPPNSSKIDYNATDPDALPDYESESEFFKNLGLIRHNNTRFKCKHVKPKLQNISNKIAAKMVTNKAAESIRVKAVSGMAIGKRRPNPSASPYNGHTVGRLRMQSSPKRTRSSLPDDVIISPVLYSPRGNTYK